MYKQSVRIIGVDPGLSITGYGIVEMNDHGDLAMVEGGIIRTKAKDSIELRLSAIHEAVAEVIHEFDPSAMAIEDLHSRYRNLKTAIIMGHARGVAVLAAGQAALTVHHYQPTRVKSVVTGSGSADKEQMLTAVRLRLALHAPLEQQDVADALGVAICHAQISQSATETAAHLAAP